MNTPLSAKWRVGVLGATGMVGQRFVALLQEHPWFDLRVLAASANSAGKTYEEAIQGRQLLPLAPAISKMRVQNVLDLEAIAPMVDFVFCALSLGKEETRQLEEAYARAEIPVVSNNSACRTLPDVPMLIPEINADHLRVLDAQRRRLGTKRGFIVTKPNCSIQSYVPALHPLRHFGIRAVSVCTYQALSGAGKTLDSWPEMQDNIIPFIPGEEEKSEQEPLKILGSLDETEAAILPAASPKISAQCLRVPVSDGHLAALSLSFETKPTKAQILDAWQEANARTPKDLPSSADPYLRYYEREDRPQTRLDRDLSQGMGIAIGRLREDRLFDFRFVCLSHNTLRGAAGGAVLTAELLCRKGLISKENTR